MRTEKVKNGRNSSKFRKPVIHKQILDFHCHSKILCQTSKLWNFVKITGLYCWVKFSPIEMSPLSVRGADRISSGVWKGIFPVRKRIQLLLSGKKNYVCSGKCTYVGKGSRKNLIREPMKILNRPTTIMEKKESRNIGLQRQ